jgi:DNA repair protein RecO
MAKFEGNRGRLDGILVGIRERGEADGLVQAFSASGPLNIRARGIRRQASRLAARLLPAGELRFTLTPGRGNLPLLTGLELVADHPRWRRELDLLALYWFIAESCYVSASDEEQNTACYQLAVNLLRSEPELAAKYALLAVYCLRLLAITGLRPALATCALSGAPLEPGAPVFLLPSGEGLIGTTAYNEHYARSGALLLRVSGKELQRWQQLASGPLLDYAASGASASDAAALLHITRRQLNDTAGVAVRSAEFLLAQWKLPTYEELAREKEDGAAGAAPSR